MILSSVTVTGPPSSICFLNRGITLPFDPKTLPKRTAENFVFDTLSALEIISSANRLVAPITFVGRTALSLDTNTNFLTSHSIAASTT